jgi:hypothetical protein
MLSGGASYAAPYGLGRSEEAETILSRLDKKSEDDSSLIAAQAMRLHREPERGQAGDKGSEGDNGRLIEILQNLLKLFYADSSLSWRL